MPSNYQPIKPVTPGKGIVSAELNPENTSFAIIVAQFNQEITFGLRDGIYRGFRDLGVSENQYFTVYVPGACEIPLPAQLALEKPSVCAGIAVAAIIRGETNHYDYVCKMVTEGVLSVSMSTKKPLIYCVLTCDNEEQAKARSHPGNNKGYEAAVSAVWMAEVTKNLNA